MSQESVGLINYSVKEVGFEDLDFVESMAYAASFERVEGAPTLEEAKERNLLDKFTDNWGQAGDFGYIAVSNEVSLGVAFHRKMRTLHPDMAEDKEVANYPGLIIATLQQVRRQGIASRLLYELTDHANASQMGMMFLKVDSSNDVAMNMYLKRDFRVKRMTTLDGDSPREAKLLELKLH